MSKKKFTKQYYMDELKKRNALNTCYRCNNKNFLMLDGYSYYPYKEKLNKGSFGKKAIPAMLVVCTNCGVISAHSKGALENNLNLEELLNKEGNS